MPLLHQVETQYLHLTRKLPCFAPNNTSHRPRVVQSQMGLKAERSSLLPTWKTPSHSWVHGKETAPRKNVFAFQDRLTDVQRCHTESLSTEEISQLERRMAVGKLLVKSVLAAVGVHKAGSVHTLWAPFPQWAPWQSSLRKGGQGKWKGEGKSKHRAEASDVLPSPHLLFFIQLYFRLSTSVLVFLAGNRGTVSCSHFFSLHLTFPASASRLSLTSAILFIPHNDWVRSRCSCPWEDKEIEAQGSWITCQKPHYLERSVSGYEQIFPNNKTSPLVLPLCILHL